jgi:uncharacterized protein
MMPAVVAGEALELLATRAMVWPRRRTVFIADPHWGKAAAFLAGGRPIPQANLTADLQRLAGILASTAAERLVILGDLFHARAGRTDFVFETVAAWRAQFESLHVLVVRGNHDRYAGDPPGAWGFDVQSEPVADMPFALRHFPEPTAGLFTLAGHIHPAVKLLGPGRERLMLSCFHFTKDVGVLPAFGGFTGTAPIVPAPGDSVFAIADTEIVRISDANWRTPR